MEQNEEYNLTSTTIKHLDYLQNSIARMGSHSFQVKGWFISIVTIALTLFANSVNGGESNPYFLLVPILPTIIFWMIDASFLSTERKMRAIYDDLIKCPSERTHIISPLSFPIREYSDKNNSIWAIMFHSYIFLLYGGILGCLLVWFACLLCMRA